jgi:hypothetical protein
VYQAAELEDEFFYLNKKYEIVVTIKTIITQTEVSSINGTNCNFIICSN